MLFPLLLIFFFVKLLALLLSPLFYCSFCVYFISLLILFFEILILNEKMFVLRFACISIVDSPIFLLFKIYYSLVRNGICHYLLIRQERADTSNCVLKRHMPMSVDCNS